MIRPYALRRLLEMVPTLLGVIAITFIVVHAAPGDPVVVLAGEGADAEQVAALREKFGLDDTLPEQFVRYMGNLGRGDLGTSLVRGKSVVSVIGERLPATVLLTGTAVVLSSVIGLVVGAATAGRANSRTDRAGGLATLIGYSVPAFWLGQVALLVLGLRLGLFPVQGMTDARSVETGMGRMLDIAHHLALPAVVLSVSEVALVARLTRSNVMGELAQPYVRTARAIGLARRRIVFRHALPNALLPVMTVIGSRFGALVSGAVLVETVFAWPGLGQLLVSSTRTRDYPVLLGMVLLTSASVILANLLTDLVYSRVDPRIRLA